MATAKAISRPLTLAERRKAALLARDFLLELERERREKWDYCIPALARRQAN
jgi:hypothetical protein